MVCTGAKSEKEAKTAVFKIIGELKKNGIIIKEKPELKIVNIVASANLRGKIDLEKAAFTLGRTMYEPEQFPGLIYRMDDPKVVILIFTSGKLVCTGANREEDVHRAVEKLQEKLEKETTQCQEDMNEDLEELKRNSEELTEFLNEMNLERKTLKRAQKELDLKNQQLEALYKELEAELEIQKSLTAHIEREEDYKKASKISNEIKDLDDEIKKLKESRKI